METFNNEDYEKYILGCMILDNNLIDIIKGKVLEEYFYTPANRFLFRAICKQMKEKNCCSILSLVQEYKQLTPTFIASITDGVTSTGNWEFYATQIKQMWLGSRIPLIMSELTDEITPDNALDTLHTIDSEVTKLMEYDSGKPASTHNLVEEITNDAITNSKMESPYLGLASGWEELDEILDGIQLGKLLLIGARPSMGKTSLAIQLADNLVSQNIPTCVFSLEMSAKSLITRLASIKSGIPIRNIQHGLFIHSQGLLTRFNVAMTRIYQSPLEIFDKSLKSEKELISRIRVEAKTHGTKIFFIDHIGLVPHSDKSIKRFEQLDDISQKLLHLAQELHIAIICLCQLKRDAEGKEPTLSDLRDSGTLEQNADICMFIHRPRATSINDNFIETKLIVIKNRDGACGTANLLFMPQSTKFIEASKGPKEEGAA